MSTLVSKLQITNFRSCIDTSIELKNFTACIGYNNAGKSNIILALKFLLSATVKSFPIETNAHDTTSPIVVKGRLINVTEDELELLAPNHKEKIRPYIIDEVLEIKREMYQQLDKEGKLQTKTKLTVKNQNDEWDSIPSGIDNSITDLFPNLIHIPAMADANEDATKYKASTTIGQLVDLISDEVKTKNHTVFKTALDSLSNLLDCKSESRLPELSKKDNDINRILDNYFPDISIRIDFPTPNIDDIFKSGTIKVFDNHKAERNFEFFGHGTQRSIQMALLQYLADMNQTNEKKKSNIFICIDEPELYLHPHAINCAHESLVKLKDKGYQVLITTHSPMMLSPELAMNAVQIYKCKFNGTKARATVNQAIEKHPHLSQLYDVFKINNASVIFFNEFVLLAEGKTEIRLLSKLYSKINQQEFHNLKIGVIETSGKHNLMPMQEVIGKLGIPTLILADLDYIGNCINNRDLSIPENNITALIDKMKEINTRENLQIQNSLFTKSSLRSLSAKQLQQFVEHQDFLEKLNPIREILKLNNIFIWGKGDMEAITKIKSKDEVQWHKFLQSMNTDNFKQSIEYSDISEFCEWIKNTVISKNISTSSTNRLELTTTI